MLVRREAAEDVAAVRRVHALAFPTPPGAREPVEVALVDALRRSPAWLGRLSLVAVVAGEVVGHVVCTRAALGTPGSPVLGLAPIGVRPDHQGRGAGSALMHAVLAAADARDEPLVGLLGDPGFYRRFGFVPATELGVEAPDAAWGDAFQVRPLTAYTPRLTGRFRYARPFEEVGGPEG